MLKNAVIKLIHFYQNTTEFRSQVAQALHFPIHTHSCRFSPTCSENFVIQVESKGVIKGTWEGFKQIAKCHPFSDG